MKVRKIESLKKNVYLIDGYDDEHDAYYYMSDCPILKRYRCLGKLKDLTGDDVRGLVQKMRFSFSDRYLDYKPYLYSPNHFATPKQSFLSALEAEGVVFSTSQNINPEIKGSMVRLFAKMKEAEENVFSSETLVFVEQ